MCVREKKREVVREKGNEMDRFVPAKDLITLPSLNVERIFSLKVISGNFIQMTMLMMLMVIHVSVVFLCLVIYSIRLYYF